MQLYQESAYRAALVEFQRAYALAPDYRVLYNIAQTELEVHDYVAARQNFERYLRDGGAKIGPVRRAQVQRVLATLRERIGQLRIDVNRDGSDVLVDDVLVGVSPLTEPVQLSVGRHRVLARADDGSVAVEVVDIAGREQRALTFAFPPPQPTTPVAAPTALPAVAPVAAPVPPAPPVQAARGWSAAERTAVTSWTLGGALLAAGATTGVLALRADRELDDLLGTRGADRREAADQRRRVRAFALSSDVLLASGGAAVAAGLIAWLVRDREEAPSERAQVTLDVQVGLGSIHALGRF